MKLEISIADDRELRNFIKDSIKGEIVSISRGEIKGIIASVVKDGVIPQDKQDLERLIRGVVTDEVKSQLKASYFGSEIIKQITREEVQKIILELFDKKRDIIK